MASGHVNRTNRPNTWLHRPACKREERPCQLGAVHTWHKADMPTCLRFVRFEGQSGHWLGDMRCPLLTHSGHWTAVNPAVQQHLFREQPRQSLFFGQP